MLAHPRRGVFVAAALAPLLMLVLAWDLSRIVVATQFCCLLCMLFAVSGAPSPAASMELTRAEIRVCYGLAVILLISPLFYGYFEQTFVVRNAVLEAIPVIGPWLHQVLLPFTGA